MTDNPLKTSYPIFEVTLPTTGRKISCRPFLVKEERILLMAKQSGSSDDISQAIGQIIRNCVLDKDFNLDSLSVIDVDYLFLRLRSEAVGNVITVDMICNNTPEGTDKECDGEFQFKLPINDAKMDKEIVTKFEERELNDLYMIKFRYPSFEAMRNILASDSEDTKTAKRVRAVVDYVAPKDKDAKEIVFDDLKLDFINEWIETLTTEQFDTINKFIEDMPTMAMDVKTKCPKCGFEHEGHFDNLLSFFP